VARRGAVPRSAAPGEGEPARAERPHPGGAAPEHRRGFDGGNVGASALLVRRPGLLNAMAMPSRTPAATTGRTRMRPAHPRAIPGSRWSSQTRPRRSLRVPLEAEGGHLGTASVYKQSELGAALGRNDDTNTLRAIRPIERRRINCAGSALRGSVIVRAETADCRGGQAAALVVRRPRCVSGRLLRCCSGLYRGRVRGASCGR
jgi:hypothetical protein